jgi:Domain of Unknown Function (DUF1080)
MKKTILAFVLTWVFLDGFAQKQNHQEWVYLFDGQSVDAFRGYKMVAFPDKAWAINENGELMSIPTVKDAVDLITVEKYKYFELEFEWKIGKKRTNSGVFFHVSETPKVIMHNENEPNWLNNFQYQLVDHVNYHDKSAKRATGSLYDLLGVSEDIKPNPIGQYNYSKLVVHKKGIEHWLNGEKVVTYSMNSPKVAHVIGYSKYQFNPNFGKNTKGHIMLQHHYGEIVFRTIKIREL